MVKFGMRKPSIRKSIAARTSVKRYIRHSLGVKAPRGWGWITNPKKALYNKVYRKTTFSIFDIFKFFK
ncbi:MAG: hypothetical protein ACOX4S_00865 [Anaerovoracaceae bacterium]|jgi:hypothetical protein|uniref:hypothetical protein n=1 Tax=Petroclostridium xylanilyticum TaxID=1792311 RepID=UPI0031191E38